MRKGKEHLGWRSVLALGGGSIQRDSGKETHIWILGEQLGRWRLRQGEWKRKEEELLNGEIQKERREM